jgi:proteic killer suppression protein
MLRTTRHKGLRRLHEDGDPRGVIAEHADKLRDIFARLDAVLTVADMDVPGLRLHPLKGREKGLWAVTVRANWRVILRFASHDAFDVDYKGPLCLPGFPSYL